MLLKKNSFQQQLILFYLVLFVLFGIGVFLFQQYREKTYRREALQNTLHSYTQIIEKTGFDSINIFPSNLRITLIDSSGSVLFDNEVRDVKSLDNHISRPEIQSATTEGNGTAIRHSETKGIDYFYYATRMGNNYMRVALPYDSQLRSILDNDTIFLSFFVLLFIAALLFVIYISNRFGRGVKKLHQFIYAIEQNEDIELNFPNNELGDISRKIVENYNLLKDSEERLNQEHHKLIESIEISKRLKHEMTGNIAHELKTPVAVVSGYIETLISQSVSAEKQRQFLERCNEQIIRLSTLINDIALITKIEEAPTLLYKENVNLFDILSEVLYDLDEKIVKAADSVEYNLPESIFINGNKTLIYSIFRNLIENTIFYAGRGVTISIKLLESTDTYYTISYSDNGVGIAPIHFARIFERFYRVDFGRARDDGGSGLGLSIVKNAVSIHGGEIYVRTYQNRGLEFVFTLMIT